MTWLRLFAFVAVAAAATIAPAGADEPTGLGGLKQVIFYVGTSPGAGYDLYARTFAQFLPRHLPGNPRVVVQNMLGAAGQTLASRMFTILPSDGSAIAMAPASIVLAEAIDPAASTYRSRDFKWIGTLTTMTDVLAAFKSTGVETIADAKKTSIVIGASGRLSNLSIYPRLVNSLLGTKFKVVHGYPGGNEINLAMANGEVQGRTNQWDSWVSQHADWISDRKLSYLVQFGPKVSELGDTPELADLVSDPREKALVDLVEVIERVGRSIFTSPKIAPERLAVWRKAFDDTSRDEDYLTRMKALGLDTLSRSGADLQSDLTKTMVDSRALQHSLKTIMDTD